MLTVYASGHKARVGLKRMSVVLTVFSRLGGEVLAELHPKDSAADL